MLVVSNLAKRFAGENSWLLQNISFIVNRGDRVGLIGPNGSGKSTLLKIILGEIEPDAGSSKLSPPDLRIGYLAQGVIPVDSMTVEQVVLPGYDRLHQLETNVETLASQLGNDSVEIASKYDAALDELIRLSETIDVQAVRRAMDELGINDVTMDTSVATLSGGQKTRLMLAALTATRPDLLLLDEPTNHLDVDALAWLETWLRDFPGGVLIVSHDRAFLDRLVNQVVTLSTETPNAEITAGNYSDYLDHVRREREKHWSQWKDQEDEIVRLQADVSRTMSKAIKREKATVNDFQRGRAKVLMQKAKAKETRLNRYLDSDERVEKPAQTWDVNMAFMHVDHISGDAIRLEDVSIGYDQPLLSNVDLAVQSKDRIAIMGPNGHGKSTLMKTILRQLRPLAGDVYASSSAQIGYLAQEQEVLDPTMTPLGTIQSVANMTETEARSFLHFYLFGGDDSLRPNSQLSYGERARLMLARLVAGGANVLMMDEPLNHLDLISREKFEGALSNFPGAIIAIVHDRYFAEEFATHIWHIADGKLTVQIISKQPEGDHA
jgi:ATP-binding cassette subfamily F protein 3